MSVEDNVELEEVTMIAARSACSQKGGYEIREEFSRISKSRNVNHHECEMWLQEGSLIPWELEMYSLGRAWLIGMLKAVS